jgi:Domain of unknown function (DUF4360)
MFNKEETMKTKLSIQLINAIALTTLCLLNSSNVSAQSGPSATFSKFSYSGTGCPAGSATGAIVTMPGYSFEVDFTKFNIPFNSPPANQSKECMLTAEITPSAGYKVSVHPAIYTGDVGNATIGFLSAGHEFNGTKTPLFSETYKGPFKFSKTHSAATAYTACAAPAVLKDHIKFKVNPADPSTGGVKKAKYIFQFQPCAAIKVDAVSEDVRQPTNAAGTTNVASNDSAPPGSTYSLTGGTCANAAVSPTGTASYTSPNTTSGASCTVIYKVCAPAPNQTICDTATLTVTGPKCGPLPGGGTNC